MTRKRKSKAAAPHRSGFLFMILILLVLGLIFYIYRDRFTLFIMSSPTLSKVIPISNEPESKKEKGSLFDKIVNLDRKEKKEEDEPVNSSPDTVKPKETESTNKVIIPVKEEPNSKESLVKVTREKSSSGESSTPKVTADSKESREDSGTVKKSSNSSSDTTRVVRKDSIEKKETVADKIVSRVYFSRVDGNDRLYLVEQKRKVSRKLPLTETLNHLLSGPYGSESADEILSTIPGGTRLLSIKIKNNIAYLNFSREFEFNKYGKESTLYQLKQIVYTATEFSNIKAVQFMIEGNIQTYLGGEGVMINSPLSRSDFK